MQIARLIRLLMDDSPVISSSFKTKFIKTRPYTHVMKMSAEVLIENSKGDILMLLRDDKPTIKWPNQWDFLGGVVEPGETPEEGVRRELMEELELELPNLELLKIYDLGWVKDHVFHSKIDIDTSKVNLHEGQRVQYFPVSELKKMTLASHGNEVINDIYPDS